MASLSALMIGRSCGRVISFYSAVGCHSGLVVRLGLATGWHCCFSTESESKESRARRRPVETRVRRSLIPSSITAQHMLTITLELVTGVAARPLQCLKLEGLKDKLDDMIT